MSVLPEIPSEISLPPPSPRSVYFTDSSWKPRDQLSATTGLSSAGFPPPDRYVISRQKWDLRLEAAVSDPSF